MKPLILTILLVTLSAPVCFGEWAKVGATSEGGYTFYIDHERIREHDGYVYFWVLTDFPKPRSAGDMSAKTYYQGDCNLFRLKGLDSSFYRGPMGEGDIVDRSSVRRSESEENMWDYPTPDSTGEAMLEAVCDHVKSK